MKEKINSIQHGYENIYRSNGTMPLDCGARGGQPRFPTDGKISVEGIKFQINPA
ncbi:MAG: hypothetical protein HOO06_14290 [Bdellovibrionaceae bacterium]|nr:hypothetical protein [Pseudobdellovibrionaceae bacterium]